MFRRHCSNQIPLLASLEKLKLQTLILCGCAVPCAEMLLGQLPILEVDGAQLAQPKAIASFLAAEFGLAGATAFEAAECHALLDCVGDMASGPHSEFLSPLAFIILYRTFDVRFTFFHSMRPISSTV